MTHPAPRNAKGNAMKTAIKPRRMWMTSSGVAYHQRKYCSDPTVARIIALPADAASVEALREKIANELLGFNPWPREWKLQKADAILALLKLSRGRRGKT